MVDPGQRIADLRATLSTYDQLLEITTELGERREILLKKALAQEKIEEMQSDGIAFGGPQQPAGPPAAQRAPDIPQTSNHAQVNSNFTSTWQPFDGMYPQYYANVPPSQGYFSPYGPGGQTYQASTFANHVPAPDPVGTGGRESVNSFGTGGDLENTRDGDHLRRDSRFPHPRTDCGTEDTMYEQANKDEPYYNLIYLRNGRMVELECPFCGGNCTIYAHHGDGSVKVLSGFKGLLSHLNQAHKDRDFQKNHTWLINNCVRKELTLQDEQMIRDARYGVVMKVVATLRAKSWSLGLKRP